MAEGSPGETGRRRFSAAHELGHHLRGDDYRAEVDGNASGEAFANAFAVDFLLPRAGAQQVFARRSAAAHVRPAMLETATVFWP